MSKSRRPSPSGNYFKGWGKGPAFKGKQRVDLRAKRTGRSKKS